jgi:hypothetical protein
MTISFPAAFLKALVHLTLRGFRFILMRELENENGIQRKNGRASYLKFL